MQQPKILVVGDSMLDRYAFGEVTRISPEAPVPVVRIKRKDSRPGGAANVAMNVAALGAQCTLLTVIGDDQDGRELIGLLDHVAVMAVSDKVTTTAKLRIIAGHQQLLRIDHDSTIEENDAAFEKLIADFRSIVGDYQAVILSDYGRGVLKHDGPVYAMMHYARKADVPVFVDPRGSSYARFEGAYAITPNMAELTAVVGRCRDEAMLIGKCEALRQHLRLDLLVLTRGELGMTQFSKGCDPLTHKADALEVFDVSGAGDTVIATLTVMKALGMSDDDAVEIANRAAGIVVGKRGTATVTREELLTS